MTKVARQAACARRRAAHVIFIGNTTGYFAQNDMRLFPSACQFGRYLGLLTGSGLYATGRNAGREAPAYAATTMLPCTTVPFMTKAVAWRLSANLARNS